MRRILLAFICLFFIGEGNAQTVLSFFCNRDTLVPCATTTMNLKARTCDIKNFTAGSTYAINPMTTGVSGGCYSPYVPPELPGNPVTLNIDDRYSNTIPLGFNFPFFGTVYNSVVLSTNGYISFDVSLAGAPSHWQMFGNLPSGSYDRALIMGPYHDLDPSVAPLPVPPAFRCKYDVVGNAPHRRFVFSFLNVPLFSGPCNSLNQNTHQIVLYESTGIIEVFIQSKQICSGWNSGKAMIGLQDITRLQGFTVPGRGATDPPWGSINMNESWRFVPTGGTGTSLLKRVELINYAGTIIQTGTIGAITNGYFDIDFPNITPGGATTNYIIRSVYEKFDDPAVEIIAHDTVNVVREPATFTVSTTTTNVLCNGDNTGSITFTNPLGPTYEYSINAGVTWQVSPNFPNLPAGTYDVRAREGGSFCAAFNTATITQPPPLTLTHTKTQTNCSNKTGTITLTASGGTPGYQYSIDGGATYVPSNVFNNLSVGNYDKIQIKDANNCIKTHPPIGITLKDTMRLELGPDSTICIGQKVLMLTQTNTETDTFKWIPSKPLLDYDTARNPIFSPKDTTKYTVVAKWGICPSQTDNITINVKHKPIPEAGKDTTVCYKTIAYLKGSATNLSGSVNYAWAPPTLVVPNNTANAIAYPDTTRYFYLTVTDNYGCNFSVIDSVKITMRDPVPAFAGNDTIAMYNKPHQLEATGGVGFVWTPAAPLNNPFARMPLAILKHDQYFEVKVTDDIGCSAVDGVFIRAIEGPTYHVPNAFSPNGDGLNEIFTPIPSGIKTTDYFRVFDRYGTLMFQTQEWLKGWNGKFNGQPALAGTYVWMIKGTDVNGTVVELQGTVILIR
jgi:gliding motility-associated-like protein